MLGRSGLRAGAAWVLLGLAAVLCAAASVSGQSRTPQLRPRPRLGRDKALDVLAYFRPGLKPEEMEKLDFDKSIGFFQGWEPRAAVLCIKDDELKFPAERAPIFLFVTALDLTEFEGAFGGLGRGIYAAVGAGGDDAISIYKFAQRGKPLRKFTTKEHELSRESPAPRYFVQAARGGAFTLHMFVGNRRYEWALLQPKTEQEAESTPARRPRR